MNETWGEDWPLIHDQPINLFLFVIIFITITKLNDHVEMDKFSLKNDLILEMIIMMYHINYLK